MDTDDFHIGQEVYVVHNGGRGHKDSCKATITKIGRRWINYECRNKSWLSGRFDPEDMWVDGKGYSSPGKVYLSQEDFDESTLRNKAYRDMYRRMLHNPTTSLENVQKARVLLGFGEYSDPE